MPDRPYVICHMMSTIDGKIDSGVKGVDILGDYYGEYARVEKLLEPQAWLCGRVTSSMVAESVGTPLPDIQGITEPVCTSGTGNYLFVVDTKGVLRWKTECVTFGDGTVHSLAVIVDDSTPGAFLNYLHSKGIAHVPSGIAFDPNRFLRRIREVFGVGRIVLEGGAVLNGSMLEAGCVDEISLIVTPTVLGRPEAPSVFGKTSNTAGTTAGFSLIGSEQISGGCIWLRYGRLP